MADNHCKCGRHLSDNTIAKQLGKCDHCFAVHMHIQTYYEQTNRMDIGSDVGSSQRFITKAETKDQDKNK